MDEIYTGKDAGQIARKKARYGHRDWLVWTDKQCEAHSALCTPSNIKKAMLDVGTQGTFIRVCANDAIGLLSHWSDGARYLRNAKYGL